MEKHNEGKSKDQARKNTRKALIAGAASFAGGCALSTALHDGGAGVLLGLGGLMMCVAAAEDFERATGNEDVISSDENINGL